MKPTTTPVPAKRSLKFLWILIPVIAVLFAGGIFIVGAIVASTLSNVADDSKVLDKAAVETAITATSPNITTTAVEVSKDGFTRVLWINPAFSTESVTSEELGSILKTAYNKSLGKVSTIEIRAESASSGDPIDLKEAAIELGIQNLNNIHSVTYSTATLEKAYAN